MVVLPISPVGNLSLVLSGAVIMLELLLQPFRKLQVTRCELSLADLSKFNTERVEGDLSSAEC